MSCQGNCSDCSCMASDWKLTHELLNEAHRISKYFGEKVARHYIEVITENQHILQLELIQELLNCYAYLYQANANFQLPSDHKLVVRIKNRLMKAIDYKEE